MQRDPVQYPQDHSGPPLQPSAGSGGTGSDEARVNFSVGYPDKGLPADGTALLPASDQAAEFEFNWALGGMDLNDDSPSHR